jgi:hypothetical protein
MVQYVVKMDAVFKIIAPTVRHDPAVYDVDLPYRPGIEAGLGEEFLQLALVTNLDVSAAKTKPLHQRLGGNCPRIAVVQYPGDRCDATVNAWNLMDLEVGELVPLPLPHFDLIGVGSVDRLIVSVNVNVEIGGDAMLPQRVIYSGAKSKARRTWNWRNLCQVFRDGKTTQKTVTLVPDNPIEFDLEEMLRIAISRRSTP